MVQFKKYMIKIRNPKILGEIRYVLNYRRFSSVVLYNVRDDAREATHETLFMKFYGMGLHVQDN
jgi:hypothetical protein